MLGKADPELFQSLAAEFGEAVVRQAEREVTLCLIDRCWSDHLANVAEIRDGIHLMSIGGQNAFDEFNRQINHAFHDISQRIDDEVIATLRTLRMTAAGIDLQKEGLLGPSSTWTYTINDNPMGDVFERLTRGIKRMVRQLS